MEISNMKKWLKTNKKMILANLIIYFLIIVTLLIIDLSIVTLAESASKSISYTKLTPILFNFIYIIIICGLYYMLPKKAFAAFYGIFSIFFILISFSQIIYFKIFGSLYGISSILYASEGLAYISTLSMYLNSKIIIAFIFIIFLIILNIVFILKFEKLKFRFFKNYKVIIPIIIICTITKIGILHSLGQPVEVSSWWSWDNPRNIYIYFKNPNASFKTTGIYEYAFRSIYLYLKDLISPNPPHLREEIAEYFYNNNLSNEINEYSNIFENKNIIMIMCESIDEWQVTEQTMPTLYNLRKAGLNFTNFYATASSSGRTINTEIASLSGLFKSTNSLDYIDESKNAYPYSLPNLFKEKGYTVNSVHFNHGLYYNRTILHKNLGFQEHFSLLDDLNVTLDPELDSNLAKDDYVYNLIAPKQEENFMTFVTTYSPHLPYDADNEVFNKLSIDDSLLELLAVPEDEELTIINILSNETDNFLKVLLQRLEEDDLLNDTVLVIFTDHFNYSYSDQEKMCEMKNTTEELIYRVPFIIWTKDIKPKNISLLTQTNDILPTLANMFGLNYNAKNYLRPDVFSSFYKSLIYFTDNSWYDGKIYSNDVINAEVYKDNFEYVNNIININNLIMKLNYYSTINV